MLQQVGHQSDEVGKRAPVLVKDLGLISVVAIGQIIIEIEAVRDG